MGNPTQMVFKWLDSPNKTDFTLALEEGRHEYMFLEQKIVLKYPLDETGKASMFQIGLASKLFKILENGKPLIEKVTFENKKVTITFVIPWHNRYRFLLEQELRKMFDRELVFT